jgi:hypothetical protein
LSSPCGVAWGHDGGIPGHRTLALNGGAGKRRIVVLARLGEDSFSKRATGLEHVL